MIPQPLPDEFCAGHIGRIQRLNSIYSRGQTALWIRRVAASITRQKCPKYILTELATLCGMTPRAYWTHYSLLPWECYRPDSVLQNYNVTVYVGRPGYLGVEAIRPSAFLCEQCVAEDLNAYGYSYWRRTHQLPNMTWCLKHTCVLRKSDLEQVFANSTDECLLQSTVVSGLESSYATNAADRLLGYLKECISLIQSFEIRDAMLLARLQVKQKTTAVAGDPDASHYIRNLGVQPFSDILDNIFAGSAVSSEHVIAHA